MEKLFNSILGLHILAGVCAFVAAPVAMAVKKGGRNHRRFGKFFFWCMTGVCVSGLAMSVMHSNIFLFAISGFSYYLVASGYRWTIRKHIRSYRDVRWGDWLLVSVAGLFNGFLLFLGILLISRHAGAATGYIATVFGLIGTLFVAGNIRSFIRPSNEKHAWLFNHMGGMIGGYIATVSAFSAVNLDVLPSLVQWLWPTIIGVPLLMAWINVYKRKLRPGRREGNLKEI